MSLLCSFHVGLDRIGAAKARFLDSCRGLLVPPNCNSGELVYYQICSGVDREPRSLQQFCEGVSVMSRYNGDMSKGPWDTRNSQVIEPPRCISFCKRNDQLCFYFATPITIALPLHCYLQNCGRARYLSALLLLVVYG